MNQVTLTNRPYVNSNLFSGHYLDERVSERAEWECDEQARDALEDLEELYELEGGLVEGYGEDALVDNWIDEVLDVLGFGTQDEAALPGRGGGYVDELLFEDEATRRDAAAMYLDTEDMVDLFERGIGLVEAKQWDASFDERFSVRRPYRNASHQIKHYLENTPENVQWGVLTNGRKWRLYGTKDYEARTYYEVDLPELIEQGDLEAFKYFYVFFRPAAFRESAGTTFLDEVWSESETASQELGEDLQDNVFTALRVLGRGFLETNDLDIDPDDEDALDELKEQSLVLLYRLMFVLYAEARQLIHPASPAAEDEYEENFSLDGLRLDVHDAIGEVDGGFDDEFSEHSTAMWSRLSDLFELIDEGEESLGIPPYNGGLFDREEHAFLTDHEVSDRYLAEVIYRLSTTQNGDGRYVLADYADLDTRHLGSVYEGLLEHQFRIAPEQYAAVAEDGGQVWQPATEVSVANAVETVPTGGLYVVNDEGERKATGAYYTPDYVVTYIVEETVGPLVEEIREDLVEQGFERGTQEYLGPFLQRVTDLKILDPAMGSGHFLTKATGFLAEQVMTEVREVEAELGVAFDEQHVRREIAKECIYGVDLNGMAVELAKLSMWLETLAADRPLAFLDHHFKQGNSLVGSDIESIEELESDAGGDGDQSALAEFGATREGTIDRLMGIYGEFLALENETVEDVREMKRRYAEIEQDELRRRLVAMANVHTAKKFGTELPTGAFEQAAEALEDQSKWIKIQEKDWFVSSQNAAEQLSFFHWKLAFPEIYYKKDGSSQSNPGFDAVIGNPPWVDVKGLDNPDMLFNIFDTSFNRVNIYSAFCERSTELIRGGGSFGFITPNSYLTQSSYAKLRSLLFRVFRFRSVVRLPDEVFDKVTMETAILVAKKDNVGENDNYRFDVTLYDYDDPIGQIPDSHAETKSIDTGYWEGGPPIFDIFTSEAERQVLEQMETARYRIGDLFETCLGLTPYDKHKGHTEEQIENRVFHSSSKDSGEHYKITTGSGIERFRISWKGGEWIKYGDWLGAKRELRFFTEPRCIVRQIVSTEDEHGIKAGFTNETIFHTQVGFVLLPKDGQPSKAKNLTAILNSKALTFYHRKKYLDEHKDTFQKILIQDTRRFPLPDEFADEELTDYVDKMEQLVESRSTINLKLLDYLTTYSEGPSLADVGTYQPPDGVRQTRLTDNKEDIENLRLGRVVCEKYSSDEVIISATARYKPGDSENRETDRWGYTETDPIPAMRLTDLTETEADLVEAFVPVAVEKGDGFANFRETATKRMSPIDRLEALTLPDPDDVAEDLERYLDAVERAEELDEKIQRTDDLIDEIVYELYGLTDEEIEIVEEAVAGE